MSKTEERLEKIERAILQNAKLQGLYMGTIKILGMTFEQAEAKRKNM